MLCREIVGACSDIRTKHGNAQRGQTVEFLGAFAELLIATVIYSVEQSPSWEANRVCS